MKISNKIMLQKERGDAMQIVKHSGLSRPTIAMALKSGNGTRKTVLAIESYYKSLNLIK